MSDIASKAEALVTLIRGFGSCAVAFSGGVDSAVVAQAAQLALGEKAVAVTGASASLAQGELEESRRLAEQIGIRHLVIETGEFDNPDYVRNAIDRCYYCKTELYEQLERRIDELGIDVIVNGANADDIGDYRPGERAAVEHRVRRPLAECGFSKEDVRALAAHWGLPIWDKPAMPCLASRVAYGEQVTPERLARIDRAEQFLRASGLREVRVRYHGGDLARVEVLRDELDRLFDPAFRDALVEHLRGLGFKFVTVDLEGLRSGSLNRVVPVEALRR